VTPRPRPDRRALLDELTSRGVRITAQRRALIAVIQDANRHLDAASLLQLARGRVPGTNRATVYRTIELLKRFGLIDELDLMHLDGEKHYYEASARRDHFHLACFGCGRIEEFTSPAFEQVKADISSQAGFEIRVIRLEAGGLCSMCAGSAETSRRRETPKKD